MLWAVSACQHQPQASADGAVPVSTYFDYSTTGDQATGGIRMVPIRTPKGTFKVWTKRVGNNPRIKVLLLHGGPGLTHELFENFDGYLPKEGIEYIYYDQLDSYYSDKPNDSTLWTTQHFVEEVEQVRQALHLNHDNFYLFGQSWGGILAMEYALKYQQHLKGLIIANMMSSAPAYEQYARQVLAPQLPKAVWTEIAQLEARGDYASPRYTQLLMEHYYTQHILRKPLAEWPEFINRSFSHLNSHIYTYMQGYSEFGMTQNATLKDWDVSQRLHTLTVPTLVIAGQYDTMDPKHLQWMSEQLPKGQLLLLPTGHLGQCDDPTRFFAGLVRFVREVDQARYVPHTP